jgi:beta-lactamase regulating signal transducer with metallopeptidase domain
MEHIFQHGLSNAAAAAVLAVLAAIATRIWRNPHFAYAAWLIVLVRLVAPPLVPVRVPVPAWSNFADDSARIVFRAGETQRAPLVPENRAQMPAEMRPESTAPKVRGAGSVAPPDASEARGLADRAWDVPLPISRRSSIEDKTATSTAKSKRLKSDTSRPDVRGTQSNALAQELRGRGSERSASDAHSAKNIDEPQRLTRIAQASQPQANGIDRAVSLLSPVAHLAITQVLAAIWLCGTCCYLLLVVLRAVRFSRVLRSARREVPESLHCEAAVAAAAVGLPRMPRMAILAASLPPFVWPGWRPTVLLPQSLIESLSISQRRMLLLHEFVHIRRLDHRVRWFQIVVVALYWWNPIAWWAARRLERAEEECCDAAVLRLQPDQADGYSRTLVAVTEFLSTGKLPAPALSIGIVRANHVKRRLHMILNGPRWPGLSRTRIAVYAIAGIGLIAVTWRAVTAQNEPAPPPRTTRVPFETKVLPVEKPIDPRLAPLLKHEPMQPEPVEDTRRTKLKARYNSALGEVLRNQQELQKGSAGAVERLCKTVPELFEAELALVATDDDKIQILESYVDYCNRIWLVANARFKEHLPGVSRADEARARQARSAAETRLNELHAAIDAAAYREQTLHYKESSPQDGESSPERVKAPRPQTAGSPQSGGLARPVPAVYYAKTLPVAPGDDQLHKLLKEKYNAAVSEIQIHQTKIQNGVMSSFDDLLNAGENLRDAALGLAESPGARVEAVQNYLALTKHLENLAEAWRAVGAADGPKEVARMRSARLDADLRLEGLMRERKIVLSDAAPPIKFNVKPADAPSGSVARPDAAVSFAGLAPDALGPLNTSGKSLADLVNFREQELQPKLAAPWKQLKERYNDALRTLKSRVNRFEQGKTSARLLCDAASEFTDARLALFADPVDRVPIANWFFVFALTTWKEAEAKLHAGGNTPENRDDEAAARDAISEARSTSDIARAALPALMRSKIVEISPNDDERQKLLVERFNAALRQFRAAYSRFRVGSTAFPGVIAAARELHTADVARSRPEDVVVAHERGLELLRYLESQAESIHKANGLIGPDEVEETHAARLSAEIELLEARRAVGNQKPSSGGEAKAGTVTGAPEPLTTRQPGSKTLPALLTAEPLKMVAGDDDRQKLLKERYNAAIQSLKAIYNRHQIDPSSTSWLSVVTAARQVLPAELALAKPQDAVAVHERYFDLMKSLDELIDRLFKDRAFTSRDELEAAHEARLDAEIKLLDARQSAVGQPPRNSAQRAVGAAPAPVPAKTSGDSVGR